MAQLGGTGQTPVPFWATIRLKSAGSQTVHSTRAEGTSRAKGRGVEESHANSGPPGSAPAFQPLSSAFTTAIHCPASHPAWCQLTGESHFTPEIPQKGLPPIRLGEKKILIYLCNECCQGGSEALMSPWLTRKRHELVRTEQ